MTRLRADRIIARRKALGLSQSELGREIGLTQQAIQQMEDGQTSRTRKMTELTTVLQCSADWLLGGDDEPDPPQGVGLISWVQAGSVAEIINNFEPRDAIRWIDYPAKHDKMYALEVRGSSMNRVSPDKSIIIIDSLDQEMSSNRLYVVSVDGEATYKRYRSNPPRLEPDSTEPHDTIFLDGLKYETLGRVVRSLLDFD